MKKYLPIILIFVLAFLGGFYFLSTGNIFSEKKLPRMAEVFEINSVVETESKFKDFTATFEINTFGTKRIFTSSMYHNLSPEIYIEAGDPSQIIVKSPGKTWADFFATLPMELSKDCLITGTKQTFCSGEGGRLRFYLNEVEDKDALNKVISEGDRLVVKYEKN